MLILDLKIIIVLFIISYIIYCIYIEVEKKKLSPVDLYWKESVKPCLDRIDEINEQFVLKKKKPIIKKKEVIEAFKECKIVYKEYISICKEYNVEPKMSRTEFEDYIDKVENPLLSQNELLDKELDRTKEYYDETNILFCNCLEELFNSKKKNEYIIDEMETFINTISSKPKSFETDIKEIKLQTEQFKSAYEYGEECQKEFEKAYKGAEVVAAVGSTVAIATPHLAMWVATTFGTSSTGVAISTLSGITQSTVNGLINGTSQNPKLLTIVRLCYGLDMPLKDFFDDEVFIDIDDE